MRIAGDDLVFPIPRGAHRFKLLSIMFNCLACQFLWMYPDPYSEIFGVYAKRVEPYWLEYLLATHPYIARKSIGATIGIDVPYVKTLR